MTNSLTLDPLPSITLLFFSQWFKMKNNAKLLLWQLHLSQQQFLMFKVPILTDHGQQEFNSILQCSDTMLNREKLKKEVKFIDESIKVFVHSERV